MHDSNYGTNYSILPSRASLFLLLSRIPLATHYRTVAGSLHLGRPKDSVRVLANAP